MNLESSGWQQLQRPEASKLTFISKAIVQLQFAQNPVHKMDMNRVPLETASRPLAWPPFFAPSVLGGP